MQFVQLPIKDNCPGIPTDKIHLGFDKFSQINAKKSGIARSTGIGLIFCKMLVEVHGEEIGALQSPQINIGQRINY